MSNVWWSADQCICWIGILDTIFMKILSMEDISSRRRKMKIKERSA
jgi:hypothetical protein